VSKSKIGVMKGWIGFMLHLAMIVVLTGFGSLTKAGNGDYEVPEFLREDDNFEQFVPLDTLESHVETIQMPPFLGKAFNGFKEALAFKESQGRYHIVNSQGYLGKYQFGGSTLNLMGIHDLEAFMEDPILQERAFEANIARNKWILRKDIKRFNGKRIGGVEKIGRASWRERVWDWVGEAST